jgi:hypothetical protein
MHQKEIRNSKNSTLFIIHTSMLLDITAVKLFLFLQLTALHLNFSPSEFHNLFQSARIILFILASIIIAAYVSSEVPCLNFRFFFLETFDLIFISSFNRILSINKDAIVAENRIIYKLTQFSFVTWVAILTNQILL